LVIGKQKKNNKSLTKLTKSKEILIKMRDERGNIKTNTNEIQRMYKEYFKNLYSNKLRKLE
jgi:hypothetical protein